MDAIVWLVILLASALLAYMVTAGERGARAWQPLTGVGVFLALFGTISFGLLTVWDRLFAPKLVDEFPGENTLLFIGLLVVGALVVLVLDLLGTIDVMSKVTASMNRPNIGPGGAAGDD
jgi:hypothetical protein